MWKIPIIVTLLLAGGVAACLRGGGVSPAASPSAPSASAASASSSSPAPSPSPESPAEPASEVVLVAARGGSPEVSGKLSAPRVDFAADVLPIVDRCRPCHFEGGKMYDQLPFDRPETIHLLGERLFTRIKGEDERATLRAFLARLD